jgi:4-hydroxybenzoate polyprenyltransferase
MLRAYAQLLRIPNVFTAMADILLGWLVVRALGLLDVSENDALIVLALLLGVSSCLYCAGMVWNDVFDVAQDRRERPFRPIPSGRVSRRAAVTLATLLTLAGVGLAAACQPYVGWTPLLLALAIVAAVLLYDAWLKRTPAGPVGMGACRFLNVLLGLSAAGDVGERWMLHLAAVVGVYIAGVTWFARKEAARSERWQLWSAFAVMLAAMGLALAWPAWWAPSAELRFSLFPYLIAAWACLIIVPAMLAIRGMEPKGIQGAVKRLVLGLIGLDALLAFVHVGWPALAMLGLLVPALLIGKWVYST